MSENIELITPFNLSQNEYEKMFEATPPNTLMLQVLVVPFNTATMDEQREFVAKVTAYLNTDIEDEIKKKLKAHPHPDGELGVEIVLQDSITIENVDPQVVELIGVLMLQVGFYDPALGNLNMVFNLMTPMREYDRWVIENDSIEPVDHRPKLVSQEFATIHNASTRDIYKSGIGIWCRELVEKRNMWFITLKALLTDQDPETESKRFVDAGGWYYTQYPELCL